MKSKYNSELTDLDFHKIEKFSIKSIVTDVPDGRTLIFVHPSRRFLQFLIEGIK